MSLIESHARDLDRIFGLLHAGPQPEILCCDCGTPMQEADAFWTDEGSAQCTDCYYDNFPEPDACEEHFLDRADYDFERREGYER